MKPVRALFVSIVPSPYQRDFFRALSERPEVRLRVVYCEEASPDSPWPKVPPAAYESVLKGFYLSWRGKRFLVNAHLPDLADTDVLVLNGYTPLVCQRLLRTRATPPLIFWAEKMAPPASGAGARVQRFLARPLSRADTIVAIGRHAAADYAQRYPNARIETIPYLCALDGFSENLPERPRQPPTVLFCGQMIPRKGVDLLLEAFARVRREGIPARLLLVGREADLPQMLEKIPEEVRASIEYAGFQAPEALPAFFRRADIFVLPSRYDGWGVVINQALGAGLPVICSDAVGAAPDLVGEGENGYIFRSGDVEGLVRALHHLLEVPERIHRAGLRSLERAKAITPEKGAEQWARILREVGGKP